MTIWNDSAISLDDIRAIADQIESQKPEGPRIDERTQIWATLTVFAIHPDSLAEVERRTDKEILWNEILEPSDDEENGSFIIFNPPELEFKLPEIQWDRPSIDPVLPGVIGGMILKTGV
jgi:hypothetical protein